MQKKSAGEKVQYKSLSHWFSYNWGWVLGGVGLAALLLYTNVFQAAGPKADYVISWVGTTLLSEAEQAAISEAVVQAGADQNGDGEIVTSIRQFMIDFSLTPEDYGYEDNYANILKLIVQMQAKECYLYLLEDPEQFQGYTGILSYLDGSIPSEEDRYECANWERMCVFWDTEGLEHEAWLGRRALLSGEDGEKLFPGAGLLFDALTDGC